MLTVSVLWAVLRNGKRFTHNLCKKVRVRGKKNIAVYEFQNDIPSEQKIFLLLFCSCFYWNLEFIYFDDSNQEINIKTQVHNERKRIIV